MEISGFKVQSDDFWAKSYPVGASFMKGRIARLVEMTAWSNQGTRMMSFRYKNQLYDLLLLKLIQKREKGRYEENVGSALFLTSGQDARFVPWHTHYDIFT